MLRLFLLLSVVAFWGLNPLNAQNSTSHHGTRSHSAATSSKSAASTQESAAASAAAAAAAAMAQAKAVYQRDCALCHGDNGNGQTDVGKSMNMVMPDWTNPNTLAGKSDSELFDIIRKGKGQMPSEDAGRAKDSEVHGLVAYIRTLSKGHPATPLPGSAAPAPSNAEPAPSESQPAPPPPAQSAPGK